MKQKTDIEIELLKLGRGPMDIAKYLHHTEVTVRNTLKRFGHNQNVQEYVAELLGRDASTLWGADYAPTYRKIRFHSQRAKAC